MNPIIWAAIISGGWAAIVAAIGYHYNRVTASAATQTANANAMYALDAAHAAQLWEKRAEAYVDAIADIKRRRASMMSHVGGWTLDKIIDEELQRKPEDWAWSTSVARLAAYAAEPVLDALDEASEAGGKLAKAWNYYNRLTQGGGRDIIHIDTEHATEQALDELQAAAKKSTAADNALEAAIRADLMLKPSDRSRSAQGHSPTG